MTSSTETYRIRRITWLLRLFTALILMTLGAWQPLVALAGTPGQVITFEDGSLTNPTSGVDKVIGTVVLDATSSMKGIYSADIPNVASGNLQEDFTGGDDVYVSFYMKVNALPPGDVRFALLRHSGTNVGNLVLTQTGALRLRNNTAVIGADTAPLTVGTLYHVRLHQKRGTGGDTVLEAYLAEGDTPFGAHFASTTTGTWTSQANRLRLGALSPYSIPLDAMFDDIQLDFGAPPKPIQPSPTPTATLTYTPTAAPTLTHTATPVPLSGLGPLKVSAQNPRYFAKPDGSIVYLTGSHTWSNLQDNGGSNPPPVFDYPAYLNFLQANNHNFFRLWVWEQSRWTLETTDNNYWFNPQTPYVRTGPGTALDGLAKFDLTRFNQSYFDRLRQRVIDARQKGMYVSIMLFDGWSVDHNKGVTQNNPWKGHPYNSLNNINGINGDTNADASGDEIETLAAGVAPVTALQDTYVRKIIDTVNDLDNVLYEISNEAPGNSQAWQYHMISLIKSYEAGKPLQHPVGMTVEWPNGSNADLFASGADWISPSGDLNNPPVASGAKVVIADTDHLCGICGNRGWAWKSFTHGENQLFMDGYDGAGYGVGGSGFNFNDPTWVSLRSNLGYIRTYANRLNLKTSVPQPSLCSTGYCLATAATPGAYLVYLPSGGSAIVNLTSTTGSLRVEWFNPATGATSTAASVTGGASRSFTSPFSTDSVLYLTSIASVPTLTATPTRTPTSAPLTTPTQTPTSAPLPSPTSTLAPTPTVPPTGNGLVAAYNFNEGAGNTVRDSSPFANNGTVSSPSWNASGKYGAALNFGSSTNRVVIPDSGSLDLTGGMTLESWAYPTTANPTGWQTLLLKEQSNGLIYALYGNGAIAQPYADIFSSGAERETGGGGQLTANTWTHVAATYDGTTLKLYKNGVQVSSLNYSGSITTSTGPLSIGGNGVWTNELFPGRIDEVRVYNRALSGSEITTDMNTPIN